MKYCIHWRLILPTLLPRRAVCFASRFPYTIVECLFSFFSLSQGHGNERVHDGRLHLALGRSPSRNFRSSWGDACRLRVSGTNRKEYYRVMACCIGVPCTTDHHARPFNSVIQHAFSIISTWPLGNVNRRDVVFSFAGLVQILPKLSALNPSGQAEM